MRRLSAVTAVTAVLLSVAPASAQDVGEGFNTGDIAVVTVTGVESGGPAERHDLRSTCTFHRQGGSPSFYTVRGVSHAGPHNPVATTTIRCIGIDVATRQVVFDEQRTEPGDTARLETVLAHPASRVELCASGHSIWVDGHPRHVGPFCR